MINIQVINHFCQMNIQNVLKIGGLAAVTAGIVIADNRLANINNKIGTQLLEQTIKDLKNIHNQQKTQMQGLNRFFIVIDNNLQILSKRLHAYYYRLLYFQKYQQTCHHIAKLVIEPILYIYQRQGILSQPQQLQLLIKKQKLNNKLTQAILLLQKQSQKIRQSNKSYLDELSKLQDKMICQTIIGLTIQNKYKINLIFDYQMIKNRKIASIIARKNITQIQVQIPTQMSEEDYIYKIQCI